MSYSAQDERVQEVFRVATQLYRQRPDWLTFFREVLGSEGVACRAFPTSEEFAAFERTNVHQEIQRMVADLKQAVGATPPPAESEPQRVITVRMPQSLHEALKAEAGDRNVSMNKLCILKLLKAIDEGAANGEVSVLEALTPQTESVEG